MGTQDTAARPMLSVIVPVYNNEDRIGACLESIRAQSYRDFEAIVVDDGSADRSAQIAAEFCANDSRFTFVAAEHGGVSAARNVGLDRARGRYVTFVDADDLLPADSFKFMHQSTVIYDADTICGIYQRVDGITTYRNTRSYNLANKTRRIEPSDPDLVHTWSLCNKWFSLSVIQQHHLRFEPLTHLEDAVFTYAYLRHAQAIYSCPHIVYTYRKPLPLQGRTTTQGAAPGLLRDAKKALAMIEELTADYGEAFKAELEYRFLNTPLIGDYYHRLWKTSDEYSQVLADEVNSQFAKLDAAHRAKALAAQFDVLAESGVKTKEGLLANPLAAVVVEPGVGEETLPKLLSGLYDQAEASFRVLVDDRLRGPVPAELAAMPNLSFYSGGEGAALEQARAKFIAFLDQSVIYDHRSLATMAKALWRNAELDAVELDVSTLEGKPAEIPDGSLANKLFRVDALKGASADVSQAAHDLLPAKHLKKPVVISMRPEPSAKPVVQDAAVQDERPASRPTLLQRVGRAFRRRPAQHAREGAPAPTSIPAAAPAPAKKRTPTSEFYLNLDIDPQLVVIEGLGKRPRGNSLYLVQELQKPEYGHPRIAFSVLPETREYAESVFAERGFTNVTCVLAGSDEYKRALFSARVLFNEVDFPNWWIKKPHQTYVNIWHGTPLKKLGHAKGGIVHHDANASRNFTMADYVLCANEYSIQHILGDCDVLGLTHAKALMLGYPRTGELFDASMRDKVRADYALGGKQVVAWMPTYRDYLTPELANAFLQQVDAQLSDDQMLFVNLHHKTAAQVSYEGLRHVREFPKELDIYEFLCGADALVTDYSSIMFDFAVTRRKIILHCPDEAEYERTRGLYRSVGELPFPVTHDVDGLVAELGRGIAYDDSAFVEEFDAHDSPENALRLCRFALLGDEACVEARQPAGEPVHPTFVVSDGLPTGPATDLLYALAKRRDFKRGVYLSFLEKEVDKNLESAYPLVEHVPLYATKGKPINERSEQQRLYNDLNPRAVIVLDTASIKRVRCFARFDVPTYLFVQPELAQKAKGDPKARKALKLFARWGSGLFAMDEGIAEEARALTGSDVEVIATPEAFERRFL